MSRSITSTAYDAWLASACMPSGLVRKMLDLYGSSEACYEAFQRHDDQILIMITPRFRHLLSGISSSESLSKMQDKINRHLVKSVCFSDTLFPEQLFFMQDPPAILFYQGEPSCMKRKILAMVGSRAASYTGQKAAFKLSENLSRHNVSVVSGLACGIDASAHKGCISGSSPTIAVLGCGLDRPYPADNLDLRNEILDKGGLILSEYAPGEKASGWHFPVRNRIIVGLGKALILIEAKIRSGSMTSVRHALDQGKDVFVYPGDPDSDYFEGNHQLLREGGIYFTSAQDILEDLHWLDNPASVGHNIDCTQRRKSSTPEEEAVYNALSRGVLSFEQILEKTGLNPSVLMSTLTVMQISNMIDALPGKQYQLKY